MLRYFGDIVASFVVRLEAQGLWTAKRVWLCVIRLSLQVFTVIIQHLHPPSWLLHRFFIVLFFFIVNTSVGYLQGVWRFIGNMHGLSVGSLYWAGEASNCKIKRSTQRSHFWHNCKLQEDEGQFSTHVPSFRAVSVFTLRSDADALLTGSFWSPAFITSAVRWLQSGGISFRGGGSLAIYSHNTQRTGCIISVQRCGDGQTRVAYLQVKPAGVLRCPGMTPIEHVQKHTAAAPHICFSSAWFPFDNLRGHVGLCALQICTEFEENIKLQA